MRTGAHECVQRHFGNQLNSESHPDSQLKVRIWKAHLERVAKKDSKGEGDGGKDVFGAKGKGKGKQGGKDGGKNGGKGGQDGGRGSENNGDAGGLGHFRN